MSPEPRTHKHSLGVVLPTFNSAALLSAHLESMADWLDLADAVVAVDSRSADGSGEILRQRLRHPAVRWLDHPPGLYECWNLAVGSLRTDYTYISTVGDRITREGLQHLLEVATRFGADAVISEPNFIDRNGRPMPRRAWPVRWLTALLNLQEPVCLQGWRVLVFAVAFCPHGLLGSSASNLYRTAVLKQHPFPTGYGRMGDTAWGMLHAADIRLAAVPGRFSTFLNHEGSGGAPGPCNEDFHGKLWQLARARLAEDRWQAPGAAPGADWLTRRVEASVEAARWQSRLEKCRQRSWPWIFNPAAWRARGGREACERTVMESLARTFGELQRQGEIPPEVRLKELDFRS